MTWLGVFNSIRTCACRFKEAISEHFARETAMIFHFATQAGYNLFTEHVLDMRAEYQTAFLSIQIPERISEFLWISQYNSKPRSYIPDITPSSSAVFYSGFRSIHISMSEDHLVYANTSASAPEIGLATELKQPKGHEPESLLIPSRCCNVVPNSPFEARILHQGIQILLAGGKGYAIPDIT